MKHIYAVLALVAATWLLGYAYTLRPARSPYRGPAVQYLGTFKFHGYTVDLWKVNP